jgi:DNA repair exonuclease SbcCD ATPase subunit
MRVKNVTTIQTRTIDISLRENDIDRLDHLKIDAQGAELAILEGSAGSLETVRSLNLEVQFSQLYEGTPLFGHIDGFLRARGFVLWRLNELSHCGFDDTSLRFQTPEIFNYDTRRVEVSGGGGQLLWANAYYVRQEAAQLSGHIAWEDAVRDACLARAHHYADLAELSLRRSLMEAPSETQAIIRTALASDLTFGDTWPDPIKDMQALIDELKQAANDRLALVDEFKQAADDRLALVNELKQAADDRLALIEELHGVAVSRLEALEVATAQLAARDAELQTLKSRRF